MTTQEALKKITETEDGKTKHKWYTHCNPPYEQSHGAATALRIMAGKCTLDTLKDFFGRFGYEVDININVRKK